MERHGKATEYLKFASEFKTRTYNLNLLRYFFHEVGLSSSTIDTLNGNKIELNFVSLGPKKVKIK